MQLIARSPRSYFSAFLVAVLVASCGGGEDTPEPLSQQPTRKAASESFPSNRHAAAPEAAVADLRPSVVVTHFEIPDVGCNNDLHDISNLTSSGIIDDYIQVTMASCDLDAPYSDERSLLPLFPLINGYIVGGETSATSTVIKWFESDVPHNVTGVPYGTIRCPTGFRPSFQPWFDLINSGELALFYAYSLSCVYDTSLPVFDRNLGSPDHCPVGDPINQATGNNFQIQTDFRGSGFEIFVQRTYNSQTAGNIGLFGAQWTSNLDRKIIIPLDVGGVVTAQRPGGEKLQFTEHSQGSGLFSPAADVRDTIQKLTDVNGNVTGWRITTEDDSTETYDAQGRLMSIRARSGRTLALRYLKSGKLDYAEDNFGQRMSFTQDARRRITQVTDPAQRVYRYRYDTLDNLISVEYPDRKTVQYVYGEIDHTSGISQTHALTGITDEKGVRFTIINYDVNGMAVATEHALRTERTDVSYTLNTDKVVTKAQVSFGGAAPSTYETSIYGGQARSTKVDHPCLANPTAKEIEWTYRGQIGYLKDFLNRERYSYYDDRGNESLRKQFIENGNVQETRFEWHPSWRLPTKVTRGTLTLEASYDPGTGGPATIIVTDTEKNVNRRWTYKVDALGRILEEDGPREDISDITRYAYYEAGQSYAGEIQSITNPLGQTTRFTAYDPMGNLIEMQDANGLITKLTYDSRDRLKRISRNVQVVQLEYDAVGQLVTLSLPSGRTATYIYDDAHRLTDITLNDGVHMRYSLDTEGNVVRSDVYDAGGQLALTHSAAFDGLRRLTESTNAKQQTTHVAYDLNGNPTDITGPAAFWQKIGYDSLDRAQSFSAADSGTVSVERDVVNQIWQITDANNLQSTQNLDLLGNVKSLELPAPDGVIWQQTQDSAGNVRTRSDYRFITERRTYDSIGRWLSRKATRSPAINYSYDEGPNAIGHLSGMQDAAGTTAFAYDAYGQLSGMSRTVDGLTLVASFSYNTGGNLSRVIYPSGRIVSYSYAGGQLRTVKVDGSVLAKNISQHPLGAVASWTWSSGANYQRTRDQDGLVSSYTLGAATQTLTFDVLQRLKSISDSGNANYNQTFGYDLAGRLTSYQGPDSKGKPSTQAYAYDLNGNRRTHTVNATDYSYTYEERTNYLATVSGPMPRIWLQTDLYTISDGTNRFTLDDFARVTEVSNAAGRTKYLLNGMDQRVTKIAPSGTKTHYVYGASGELLAELDQSGQTLKEYIWLPTMEAGGYPTLIGVATGASAVVNYVYTDHLGTPRLVASPNGNVLWRWVSDPFGAGAPIESGLRLNLRFAGQYFDAEHGYHYNWHRYYDAATGRYNQSDPIGLAGGINTYAYVNGNPLMYMDPYGLWVWGDPLPQGLVDYSAGFGDTLSFGLTDWARNQMGTNGAVNKCSGYYTMGEWSGIALDVAIGGAAGLEAAGTRGVGKEFSHWIPNRMGGPRSLWNGNYVSTAEHALSDPYRYRFMPKAWKAENPMPDMAWQQWFRIPNVYKGAAAGGAAGAAGAGLSSDCTCPQ
jgi:RHS repeat-associated protein